MHTFRSARPLLVALAAGLVGACASVSPLPDSDRVSLGRQYEGQTLYLRTSLHVMPFFKDPTRRLVSPTPPDSIELLEDTSGAPILPGAPEGLLALGTRVRVEKLEFPTGLVLTRRPLYTPRTLPWVYLSVAGEAESDRPYVAVLRPGLKSRDEVVAALAELLVSEDPAVELSGQPPSVREAIRKKQLLSGMSAAAVEAAWGRPERIRQQVVEGARVETWTWPLGKRSVQLRDGELVSSVPALDSVP